jgi:ComEC/Rec2-related protein
MISFVILINLLNIQLYKGILTLPFRSGSEFGQKYPNNSIFSEGNTNLYWGKFNLKTKGNSLFLQAQQIEYLGSKSESNSSIGDSFDKSKKAQNERMEKEKKTFLHNRVLAFILEPQKICLNEQRRQLFVNQLKKHLSEDTWPLISGFLLGGASNLDPEVKKYVKVSGLSHILSASGSNVSLILLTTSPFIRKMFGKFFTTFLGIAALVIYLCIAGCSPPLLRASLTGGVALLGVQAFERQVSPGWLLLLTCLFMLGTDASYATNIGFQLSVAATGGILIASKPYPNTNQEEIDQSILSYLRKNYQSEQQTASLDKGYLLAKYITKVIVSFCKETGTLTLAAQIATLPIILYHFHELSIVALVSNVGVLWLVPIILWLGVGTLVVSLLPFPFLTAIFATLTEKSVQCFLQLLTLFGRFDQLLLKFEERHVFWILFVYFVSVSILLINHFQIFKTTKWTKWLCH